MGRRFRFPIVVLLSNKSSQFYFRGFPADMRTTGQKIKRTAVHDGRLFMTLWNVRGRTTLSVRRGCQLSREPFQRMGGSWRNVPNVAAEPRESNTIILPEGISL